MARYQYGNLMIRKRRKGPNVWQFRWMENGKLKSRLVGTVERLPKRLDAERAVEHLRMRINAGNPQSEFHQATVAGLIERFVDEYVPKRCRQNTRSNYRGIFENHIKPRWAAELVRDVRPIQVENWLEEYDGSRQVKSHIRNLMHTLFNAARRWDLCDSNPLDLVRQSAKRMKTPRALAPEEFKALVAELSEPYRTMVTVAGCLGLRVSELVALKWQDIDFLNMAVNIRRGFVRGEINPTKTDASEGTLPMDSNLADMLRAHRLTAKFREPTDFVFANDSGAIRWPESILTRQIKPAAKRARIGNIGWHTFRHTYSTLLHSLRTTPAVQKELLRHANVTTTLNVYTRAVTEEKRHAAEQVSRMLYQVVLGPSREM